MRCSDGFAKHRAITASIPSFRDADYKSIELAIRKHSAVTSMVKAMAVELAAIRFNAIHPGIIGDPPAWKDKPEALEAVRKRTPGGRFATTDDVVDAVKFLFNKGING